MQQKSLNQLEQILTPLEQQACKLLEEAIGGEIDSDLFEGVRNQSKYIYGIHLKTEKGLQLFREIYVPDFKRTHEILFKEKSDKTKKIARSWYQGIQFGNTDLLVIAEAELVNQGLTQNALEKNVDVKIQTLYLVTSDFSKQLLQFKDLLQNQRIEEAREYFKESHKSFTFTPIELIAVHGFHIEARKIYFLSQTDPDITEQEINLRTELLSNRIDGFLGYSKKLSEKRWFKGRYQKELYYCTQMRKD